MLTVLGAARDACKRRTRSHTDAGKITGLYGLLKGLNLKAELEPGSALLGLEAGVGYSSSAVLDPARPFTGPAVQARGSISALKVGCIGTFTGLNQRNKAAT